MTPQIPQRRAMIRQVQPKPTLSGRLARRIGQTTDPTDEPVLITPLYRQSYTEIWRDEGLTKQDHDGGRTIDLGHPLGI
jgi:hypothetical protein